MKHRETLDLQDCKNYALTLEKAGALNALRNIREASERINAMTDALENEDFQSGGGILQMDLEFSELLRGLMELHNRIASLNQLRTANK